MIFYIQLLQIILICDTILDMDFAEPKTRRKQGSLPTAQEVRTRCTNQQIKRIAAARGLSYRQKLRGL